MAEYYNNFYKHPLSGYDPRYFRVPPKECKNCVRIALAIVTVLQLICVSKKKRYVLKT